MSKKFLFFLLFPSLLSFFTSCSDDDEDLIGNWVKSSDFEGVARGDASSFVVDNKVYVFGGYDGKKRLKDIWEYNFDQGYWTQKAEFTGVARSAAVAFAISDKGYIGTGYDGEKYLQDFWEFDPTNNIWTQKANFRGSARYGATAFSIGGMGYIGTGYDGNYLMDFHKYNPATDTWVESVSIKGSKRAFATSFIVNDKAYVVCGMNNGSYVTDFWAFDPTTSLWEEKAQIANKTDNDFDDDYTTINRLNAVSFVIDGKAYIATGEAGSLVKNTWEYNPITDRWKEKTAFEGTARSAAVAFAVKDRGFVLTGRSSSYYFDDMWEFKPNEEYNEYD